MSFDWHNELFVRLSWIRFINLFQMSSKCHFACSVTVVSGFQKLYKNKKLFCYFQTMTFFFQMTCIRGETLNANQFTEKKWKKWSKWPFFPDCTIWHSNKQSRKINGLCSVCNEAVTSRPTLANLIHNSTELFHVPSPLVFRGASTISILASFYSFPVSVCFIWV